MFLGKLPMRLGTVDADAENDRVASAKIGEVVAERGGFGRSARGIVFRVEVQHDPLASIPGQAVRLAVPVGQGDFRRRLANFNRHRSLAP